MPIANRPNTIKDVTTQPTGTTTGLDNLKTEQVLEKMGDLEKKLSIAKNTNMDYKVIQGLETLLKTYIAEVHNRQLAEMLKATLNNKPLETDPSMSDIPFIPMKKPE